MTDQFISQVFATVDTMSGAGFADFFAEDGRMVFGNGDAMVGRDQITAGVDGFFSMIDGIHHEVKRDWVVGNDYISEIAVTYNRKDGQVVTIPVVSVWTTDAEGKIADYRVFFDVAPVFA